MLERVDRLLVAVRDRAAAADTFARLLGAAPVRDATSGALAARCTVLALGDGEVELCEPAGDGPVRAHVDRWGEGLFAAGFATRDPDALAARLAAQQVAFEREDGRLVLPAAATGGLPVVISPLAQRARVGPVSFVYEVTHALDTDWREAMARHVRLFGLDPSRFSPIESARWGYEGTLTLFDPPGRLDRIELAQTFADRPGPMRRFVERRGGDCLYMAFVEAHDFDGLKARLLAAGARLAARGGDVAAERDTMWVLPASLHGLLLGVSRTSFAWTWSGRPERVVPIPA